MKTLLSPSTMSIIAGVTLAIVGVIYGNESAISGGLLLAGGGAAFKQLSKPKGKP